MKRTLAIAGVAGSLCTVAVAQTVSPPMQPFDSMQTRGGKGVEIIPDDKTQSADLREIAVRSGKVFDGVLIRKTTVLPPGMRVLMTEYVFEVHEWFKGTQAAGTVTILELGGEEADGSSVSTVESHKLALDGRYLVFLSPDEGQALFPIDRVFQVMDTGAKVADESGRVVVGLTGAVPTLRATPEVPSTNYLGTPLPPDEILDYGAPTTNFAQPRPKPRVQAVPDRGPIPAELMFRLLRAEGARPPAGPGPVGLLSATLGGADYNYCGYVNAAHNYATWLPNNNNFAWWDNAMFYWDQEVNYTANGGWLFGYLTSGGNPIRNENPVANNNRDNGGVPSDAQLVAGGYVPAGQGWANLGANGICYNWSTGGGCTRIRESDVFINPSNTANELQYRKSIVHEMGHAIGLGHEDRYVADMVSGSWRVPPNYALADYLRLDDRQGGRAMLIAANGLGANWSLQNWRDIATYSQSHPNVGTSGDVGPNVVQLSTYNASTGDNITISHLHVENRGRTAYSGNVSFNIYLSADNVITASDYNVWSGGWGSYGAQGTSYNFPLNFSIPATIPTGNYYVGWIVNGAEGQLTSQNDTAIMVRDSTGSFAERRISITGVTPYNDDCANAITAGVGTYAGTNANATTDGASTCGFNTAKDVWYEFTSPCTGTLTLDTCGSNFDTVLSVHTACPATAANTVVCNDDAAAGSCSGTLQSYLTMPVAAGTSYLIRLAGYNNLSGSYVMHVNFAAAAPPNDNCANNILVGNGTTAGSTICANNDGSAGCGASASSPDVWYRYVAPNSGALHVDTCGSPFDTVVSVHTACPGTSANQIACNDDACGLQSEVNAIVTAGQTYYIRVSGYAGSYGTFTMHTAFELPNDDCSNATPIGNGNTAFSNIGATTDGPIETLCPFCCGDLQINNDIWYVYTATCSSTTISLCSANYDSKIAVYNGAACPSSPGTAYACSDDFCGLRSQVTFDSIPGQQYLVRIGGFTSSVGSGTITITPGAASNDACANAIALDPGANYGSTSCATVDGAGTCGFQNGPDVWYNYTAPATGFLTLDTCGSNFDTVISVHTGCPGTVANEIGCDDDAGANGPCQFTLQSWLRVPVTSGNSYKIRVAGYNGQTGNFILNADLATCYANCDLSTTSPILNVLDFACFLNRFAANDPYANCDNSTTPPVLNVLDFACFLNRFAAGCS